uniref:FBA_2 domain-containing protein n=1 Tax=Caenorhabditis tropicalis TaxID=1561998 RepID=A0A1I7UTH2_9PELO
MTAYSTQDLVEFLGKWNNGSKIEKLKIGFNKNEFKISIFEQLGQVFPVNKAKVEGEIISAPCFLIIQQTTGIKAIVYTNGNNVILTTNFDIIL